MESNIKSNYPLNKLFTFSEVGYLKELFDELRKIDSFKMFNWYIYFKKTTEGKIFVSDELLNDHTILIVVGDESSYVPDEFYGKVRAIFKTYLRIEDQKNNLYYMPVGPNPNIKEKATIAVEKRAWNVFFSGNLHLGRRRLYEYLSGVYYLPFYILHRLRYLIGNTFNSQFPSSYIVFTKAFQKGLDFNEYGNYLYNSKIVLCPPGNPGIETMRHFEALRAGCIVVGEGLPPVEFFKGNPMIEISNWKQLTEVVNELLSDDLKLHQKVESVLNWWKYQCSPQAVAIDMMRKIGG